MPLQGKFTQSDLIIIRGGGDLASGVALRLYRTGFPVLILELPRPLAVRRTVSFAEAVFEGEWTVEGVTGRLTAPDQFQAVLERGEIPILVDPGAKLLANAFLVSPHSTIVIDARLLKRDPEPLNIRPLLHIGLGPGFIAGHNCDAVVETRRSHTLGRVYWEGVSQTDTGQPEGDPSRVLRAPAAGILRACSNIGDHVQAGQVLAELQTDDGQQYPIHSPLTGILRGLLHEDVPTAQGVKIGDVDPRSDPAACWLVSDKALSIGGGVLEAILSSWKTAG